MEIIPKSKLVDTESLLEADTEKNNSAHVKHCEDEFLPDCNSVTTCLYWTDVERRLWITSLFFGLTLLYATRTLVPVCSVKIAEEFNWNKSQMGAILGAFFWGYILTQYICGWLADRMGGEQIVTLGAVGWTLMVLFYPFLTFFQFYTDNTLFIMLIVRVFNGFFQGFFMPSVGSLMSSRVHLKNRGTTFTLLNTGSYFGTLLAGSVGSIMMKNYGWRSSFYLLGVLGIVWVFVTRWCLLSSRHFLSREIISKFAYDSWIELRALHRMHCTRNKLISHEPINCPSIPLDNTKEKGKVVVWSKIVRRKEFIAMMVGHYAYGHTHNILLSWLPTYFHDSFPAANGWVFNVVPWLVTIPSSLMGGVLADHLIGKGYSVTSVRKLMETLCLLGSALFLLLLPAVKESYELSLLFMAIAVCFTGFHCCGIMLNPQDLMPNHGGTIFGLMNMCGALPGFLAVYIAGFILEQTKSWTLVFNQTAVVCIVGWVVYIFYGSAERIV